MNFFNFSTSQPAFYNNISYKVISFKVISFKAAKLETGSSIPDSLDLLFDQNINRIVQHIVKSKESLKTKDAFLMVKESKDVAAICLIFEKLIKIFSPSFKKYSFDHRIFVMVVQKFFGYGVPTEEVINAIAEFVQTEKLLEVGAGMGLIAKLLRLKEVKMEATDNFSSYGSIPERTFTEILNEEAVEAVTKRKDCSVLMFVWPPHHEDKGADSQTDCMADVALEMFRGNKLIHIGQKSKTASSKFYHQVSKNWEMAYKIEIPQNVSPSLEKTFCSFYIRKKAVPVVDRILAGKVEELNEKIRLGAIYPEALVIRTSKSSSLITSEMEGHTIAVHDGKTFIDVVVSKERVGHQFGEYLPNHRLYRGECI